MQPSPLEDLFEEAGATLGRIEREQRQRVDAIEARFEARVAQIELAVIKAEQERQRIWKEALERLFQSLRRIAGDSRKRKDCGFTRSEGWPRRS